ncbi:MAG: transketolase [Nitrospirae bacterium]|nr:transketolase [Nitrospirota bacterium]MBI3352838.1 transketolase [Nitrospirota bacterium]
MLLNQEVILENLAAKLRIDILKMIFEAQSGHPGGSFSAIDMMTALYSKVMKHDPQNPDSPDRDRFILSKGHAAPALYAILAHHGYFPQENLKTLRKMGSPLQGHPEKNKLPGVEASTGSLGQGISIGIGMALAGKLDGKNYRTYVLVGDGEINEGQVWEAALFAPNHQLDHLVVILDHNGQQLDGSVQEIMPLDPLAEKWRAFGWNVIEINGHRMNEILDAFEKAGSTRGKPTIIIAKTIKGKGVSFMENNNEFHGMAPNKEQFTLALQELEHA